MLQNYYIICFYYGKFGISSNLNLFLNFFFTLEIMACVSFVTSEPSMKSFCISATIKTFLIVYQVLSVLLSLLYHIIAPKSSKNIVFYILLCILRVFYFSFDIFKIFFIRFSIDEISNTILTNNPYVIAVFKKIKILTFRLNYDIIIL